MVNFKQIASFSGLLISLAIFIYFSIFYFPLEKNFEDSFIIFRYARNLARGYGLVWNIGGAPEQGMTGHLWTILLGISHKYISTSLPALASWLGIFIGIATLIVSWVASLKLLTREASHLASVTPLILAFNPWFVRQAGSGLETSCVTAIFGVTAFIISIGPLRTRAWYGIFAIATLLAFSIRPDAILVPLVGFAAYQLLNPFESVSAKLRGLAKYGALVFFMLLLYITFATEYFGYTLPLSIHLKSLATANSPNIPWRFIASFQAQFFGVISPLLIVICLGLLGQDRTKKRLMALLITSGFFYFYLFTVIPVMNIGMRFQLPVLILLSIIAPQCLQNATFKLFTKKASRRLATIAVSLILVFANCGEFTEQKNEVVNTGKEHDTFQALGSALAPLHGISIASTEAGKLAYYSDAKFLDTIGLNDKFVAFNKGNDNYPALFEEYLKNEFGFPDVYIRPGPLFSFRGADTYAYIESNIDIKGRYSCNQALNITICVLSAGKHASEIYRTIRSFGFFPIINPAQ